MNIFPDLKKMKIYFMDFCSLIIDSEMISNIKSHFFTLFNNCKEQLPYILLAIKQFYNTFVKTEKLE